MVCIYEYMYACICRGIHIVKKISQLIFSRVVTPSGIQEKNATLHPWIRIFDVQLVLTRLAGKATGVYGSTLMPLSMMSTMYLGQMFINQRMRPGDKAVNLLSLAKET